jgi:Immunoglobulin I-set domain
VDGGLKPEFVRNLYNQNVPLGKTVTLECEATGTPKPTARWYRNGREISLGARARAESKDGVFKLVIEEATDIDDGSYTCEATNCMGFVHSTANIKIGCK